MNNERRLTGVAAYLLNPAGGLFVVPLFGGDGEKYEWAGNYSGQLSKKMNEFLSGGIEPGEGLDRALIREAYEERVFEGGRVRVWRLPGKEIVVRQTRNGEEVKFGVTLSVLQLLGWWQVRQIEDRRGGVVELGNFNGLPELRPLAHLMIDLLAAGAVAL